jgi:hypothetical protein
MTAVADGRVHVGQEAVDIGLLDAIEPLSTTLAAMQEAAKPEPIVSSEKETPMADETIELKVDATEAKKVIAEVAAASAVASADITKLRAEFDTFKMSKDIDATLAQGVADRRITPGLLETAKTVAQHGGLDGLKAFVASLPVSAPDGGSVDRKTKTGTEASGSRHRYDAFGVEVWGASTDPKLQAFGQKITWITAQETGGKKFRTSAEAFAAYDSAHATRVAA